MANWFGLKSFHRKWTEEYYNLDFENFYVQPRTTSVFLTRSWLFYELRLSLTSLSSLDSLFIRYLIIKSAATMRDWISSCLWYNLSNILDIFFWDLCTMYVSIIEHEKFIQYFRILFQKSTFVVQCSKNGKIVQYNKCECILPIWV